MAVFREIVARSRSQAPNRQTPAHSRSRTWSWRRGVDIWTLTLSCGHTKVYRGDYTPKNMALCKECSAHEQG